MSGSTIYHESVRDWFDSTSQQLACRLLGCRLVMICISLMVVVH